MSAEPENQARNAKFALQALHGEKACGASRKPLCITTEPGAKPDIHELVSVLRGSLMQLGSNASWELPRNGTASVPLMHL